MSLKLWNVSCLISYSLDWLFTSWSWLCKYFLSVIFILALSGIFLLFLKAVWGIKFEAACLKALCEAPRDRIRNYTVLYCAGTIPTPPETGLLLQTFWSARPQQTSKVGPAPKGDLPFQWLASGTADVTFSKQRTNSVLEWKSLKTSVCFPFSYRLQKSSRRKRILWHTAFDSPSLFMACKSSSLRISVSGICMKHSLCYRCVSTESPQTS